MKHVKVSYVSLQKKESVTEAADVSFFIHKGVITYCSVHSKSFESQIQIMCDAYDVTYILKHYHVKVLLK